MAATDAFAHAPPAQPRPKRRGLRPLRLTFYVLGQMLGPVAMLAVLLTGVVWLVQILPLLDLVINRGQSAFTFAYLVLLLLPTLLTIILPIAFFFGALASLQSSVVETRPRFCCAAISTHTSMALMVLLEIMCKPSMSRILR